jgi:hypothetical protein
MGGFRAALFIWRFAAAQSQGAPSNLTGMKKAARPQ